MPLLLLQSSVGHSAMGAGSNCCCSPALVCPDQIPPWMQSFHYAEISVEGSTQPLHCACADLTHPCELQHCWALALHKHPEGARHALFRLLLCLVNRGSAGWRRRRAREMRFTSPRFLVHSSKGCHCEQQSCGCRCTLASCCKNCCGTSALQSVPWKKGTEKGAQSKEEKRRLVHFNQSRYPHKHSIKQLGADKPQSISSFFCFSLMLSVKG